MANYHFQLQKSFFSKKKSTKKAQNPKKKNDVRVLTSISITIIGTTSETLNSVEKFPLLIVAIFYSIPRGNRYPINVNSVLERASVRCANIITLTYISSLIHLNVQKALHIIRLLVLRNERNMCRCWFDEFHYW